MQNSSRYLTFLLFQLTRLLWYSAISSQKTLQLKVRHHLGEIGSLISQIRKIIFRESQKTLNNYIFHIRRENYGTISTRRGRYKSFQAKTGLCLWGAVCLLRKEPRHWTRRPWDHIPRSPVSESGCGIPAVSQSAPLTWRDTLTTLGEVPCAACPADFVANIAGICVQAAGISLFLQVGKVPLCWDQLAPSVQSNAHIVILGHRAVQRQLTHPISQGLPLALQVRALNMIWKQRFWSEGSGNTSPTRIRGAEWAVLKTHQV